MIRMRSTALGLLVFCVAVASAIDDRKCSCVDDWDARDFSKIINFPNTSSIGEYEYPGAIIGLHKSSYTLCRCTDVLRLTLETTILNKTLYTEVLQNRTEVQKRLTGALQDVVPDMENFGKKELLYRFHKIGVTYKKRTSPETTLYTVDILLSGSNASYNLITKTDVALKNITTLVGSNPNSLAGYDKVTFTTPTAAECSDDAPAYQGNGSITMDWNKSKYPPTVAAYQCPKGKYVLPHRKGHSTCSHSNLKWTALETLSCTEGCDEDPPKIPRNAVRVWDSSAADARSINTTGHYYCPSGYRSGNKKNSSSTCTLDGWQKLEETFFCTEMSCSEDIPQVPDHAVTDFKNKVDPGTEIQYTCLPRYRSQNNMGVVINCSMGVWSMLPNDWSCINIHAFRLADTLLGEMDLPDSELTAAEKQRKLAMVTKPLYFWMVTIPSIICLLIAMMLCLCCTRTDSPIFNICGGQNRKLGYNNYMQKFGNVSN